MPVSVFRPRARLRRWLPATVGALLLLGAALRAADAPPPAPPSLEELKKDLQAVKRAETTAGDGSSSLKVALPSFQAAPESAPAAPSRPAVDPGAEAADANWLLNAMAPRDSTARDRATDDGRTQASDSDGRASQDAAAQPPRPSDPNYLLKLYLSQAPAANRTPAASDSWALDPAGRNDLGSFSRFLGAWVSPHDPALRGLIDAASPAPPGTAPAATPVAADSDRPLLASPEPTNPFLDALRPDLLPLAPPELGAAPPPPPPSLVTPPPPEAAPAPANRPPPSPADDKKYFPQLHRF